MILVLGEKVLRWIDVTRCDIPYHQWYRFDYDNSTVP